MDCKTAQAVWNHPEGLIAGIRQHLPGVMERIETNVSAFVSGARDPFDQAVKAVIGEKPFFVTHGDTEHDPIVIGVHEVVGDAAANLILNRHFSQLHGRPIVLGNVCCSGCKIHDGSLAPADIVAIQLAAVNIDPDTL